MSAPRLEPHERPRTNRWEVALWVVGVVLTGASSMFTAFAVSTIYQPESGDTISKGRIALESVLQLSPGVLIVGLISLLLAIFLRALRAQAIRREVAVSAAPVPEVVTIVQPAPVPPRAPEPTDHTLYMRPTAQGGAPRE